MKSDLDSILYVDKDLPGHMTHGIDHVLLCILNAVPPPQHFNKDRGPISVVHYKYILINMNESFNFGTLIVVTVSHET